jgi:seryl-tRNA synthetase
METTQQTYKRINTFINVANVLTSQEVEGNKLAKDSKLVYAFRRVMPKCQDAMADYNEQVEDINVKHASVDKDGNLLKEVGEYKYTKENAQKRLTEIRELFKTKTHEVPQYFATEVPEWLPEDAKDVLTDFVISPNGSTPSSIT